MWHKTVTLATQIHTIALMVLGGITIPNIKEEDIKEDGANLEVNKISTYQKME